MNERFKKGDMVYHWGADGIVKFFIAKEVYKDRVVHPYGGHFFNSSIFTHEEMIQKIQEAYNANKELMK